MAHESKKISHDIMELVCVIPLVGKARNLAAGCENTIPRHAPQAGDLAGSIQVTKMQQDFAGKIGRAFSV